ncbi:MAG: rRNA maturation RNase YbeY [Chloroflexota bacterium]|nr:rRNA maturation RNase YbeY [Chloroflexota bacterium]
MRSLYLPPWRIDIDRRTSVPRLVPDATLARVVSLALAAAGAPSPASVGLRLTGDRDLATLNAKHMGESGPTDVLSFPILPPEAFRPHPGRGRAPGEPTPFPLPPGARQPLGDIVVSIERAIAQASEGRGGQTGDVRWSAADELRLLVTHGVLHICGWDHAEPAEEAAMRALERQLLAEH